MTTYQRQCLRASGSQSRPGRKAGAVSRSSLRHAPAPCEFKNLIQKDPTHRRDSQNLILNAHRFSAMTSQRYRGGRQSKGDRQALISRVATPLGEAVREKAEARGMSVNDYIASVLAREVGMAELAPQSPIASRYQKLPISEVA
jgi:hypothetical protein